MSAFESNGMIPAQWRPALETICVTYGPRRQTTQTMEELAELILELAKYQNGKSSDRQVASEIADVLIMCWQMSFLFGGDQVGEEVGRKIARQLRRLGFKNDVQIQRKVPTGPENL